MSQEFSIPVRVYFEDTDAEGIVYYVNYLKFMERSRTEFLRSHGFEQNKLLAEHCMFVVHSMEVRYHKPARLDDLLDVSLRVVSKARATLIFEQKVHSANGDLLCSADVKVACLHAETMRPQAIPEGMRAVLTA